MNTLSDRIPQAGLEFLLSRVLTPRVSADDVMWYIRGIYSAKSANDAEWVAVRDRVAVAVKRAREQSLPTLIEARTYRYRGHSMSDPGKYRTPDEIEERKKSDPILNAETKLREMGVSDAELEKLNASVEAEVEDCVRFAEESAEPDESLIEAFNYA